MHTRHTYIPNTVETIKGSVNLRNAKIGGVVSLDLRVSNDSWHSLVQLNVITFPKKAMQWFSNVGVRRNEISVVI